MTLNEVHDNGIRQTVAGERAYRAAVPSSPQGGTTFERKVPNLRNTLGNRKPYIAITDKTRKNLMMTMFSK
jgi:hypothetical protein